METQKQLKYNFRWVVGLAVVLSFIGLIFIYSASSIFATEKFGVSYYFLKRQVLYLALSIVAFSVCASVPLAWWKRIAPYFFIASLVAVAFTLLSSFGLRVHGSHRWLSWGGLSFQPSEFLKFSLFVYLGLLLERRKSTLTSLVRGYLPLLGIVGIAVVVLLKQPDFGMSVTLFSTALIVFFIAGVRLSHLLGTIACAIPAVIAIVFFASYRLNRILIFLNPWLDPKGRGYQIIQSLIAIGSGGMWGVGIANSKQKFFYLPMQHTDFIFSIIAEETGYIGSLVVVLCYILLCYFGLKVAAGLSEPFAFYTTCGLVILLTFQAVINLMVVSGLVPTKGLGLPFVSYGGSALICNFCMLGLIANFVRSEVVR